ncbi:hypothetical protein [Bradyrhizobium sp.]
MSDSIDEHASDVRYETMIARYRAGLERLNYVQETINVYLRSIPVRQ